MWPWTKLWADNDGKGKQKKIGYICEVPCVPGEDTDSSNAWEDELRRVGPCEGISYIKLHFDDIAVLVSRQPIGLLSAECRLALASTESQTYDQFMTTDDRWWQHQMPVRALRHDKQTVQLSKSRGLSGSVSLNSETIRKHLLCRLLLSNTASVLVIFQNES